MTLFLSLFIALIILIAVLVRKNKTLMYFIIAAGLAVVIAFLALLNNAIKYTM